MGALCAADQLAAAWLLEDCIESIALIDLTCAPCSGEFPIALSMQGELFSMNAIVSKLLLENLRQGHCGEEFMNTFRISPKPLDLSLFLRTDKESVESNADRKAPAGRKWRSKFQEFCRRLGAETCQLLDKVF